MRRSDSSARSIVPFRPRSLTGRVRAALGQGLPDLLGEVGWLACRENLLNGGQHHGRWQDTQGGDVPEAIELQPIHGEVGGLGGVVEDALDAEVGLARRSFAGEAGRPAVGRWFLVWCWVLVGTTWSSVLRCRHLGIL